MAERLVVLIDNDPVLSERLRAVLAAYHLRVELIHDGNELSLRRDIEPALIILCIDPKRLGWAICNKIKKATQYKSVPMIVTSQEATDKDFEDHKKLRTRAEEYLHKPFGVEVLLEKVASLIGLDPPQLDESGMEEIPIDDASLIEEEILAPQILNPEISRPPPHDSLGPFIDRQIDRQIAEETDAAFAAIGAERRRDPAAVTLKHDTLPPRRTSAPGLPGVTSRAGTPPPLSSDPGRRPLDEDEIGLTFEDVVTTSVRGSANLLSRGASFPPQPAAEVRELQQALEEARRQAQQSQEEAHRAQAEADRWHDERDQLASERDHLHNEREQLSGDREQLSAHNQRLHGEQQQVVSERDQLLSERDRARLEHEQAQAELGRLREERDRVKTPSATTTSFSREREFLNLREVINKKDKELLDLRDALDSKERQILDIRDKARELDRQRRDLDERLLEVEREFVAARERIEALLQDKETGLEREKGLKARLDDAQKKLLRADEEIADWKRRHAGDVARLEEALALEKHQRDREIKDLQGGHATALQQLRDEHRTATEKLLQEHADRQAQLQAAHDRALGDQEERHGCTVAELKKEHAAVLLALAARHDEVLSAERAAHAEERAEQDARHGRALDETVSAQKQQLAELQQQQQQDLQIVEIRRQQELQTAEERRRQEVAALEQAQEARIEEMHAAHAAALAELSAQHRAQMDELTQVLTGERDAVSARLHERETELSHTRTHLAEAEASLAALRQRHQDLSEKHDHLQDAHAEKDKENAAFQDQILRAYQRIKSDEGLVSRAKKALAIALTLLDESGAPVKDPGRE